MPVVRNDVKKAMVNGDIPATTVMQGPEAEQAAVNAANRQPDPDHEKTAGAQPEEAFATASALPAIPQALTGTGEVLIQGFSASANY